MTANAQQEVPFASGFEREPEPAEAQKPVVREYTFSIARGLINIHGMIHSVADVVSALAGKVRSLAEQGPKDYAESEFERGVRVGSRHGGYHEAPRNENHLKTVVIGCTVTLLSAFVLGAWKLSNDSAALRAELTEWKQATARWMDQVDRRLDRQENQRP